MVLNLNDKIVLTLKEISINKSYSILQLINKFSGCESYIFFTN